MAYPFLLVINLLFVIFWLVLWKNYFWISVIIILIGINLPGKFFQLNFSKDKNRAEAISILSFNVHNFSHQSKSGSFSKEVQEKIFSFIESQDADIVCMQEFNYIGENIYASHAQLKQRLGSNNYFFESYFNPKKNKVFGMATFSKYPIVNSGIFEHEETRKFGTFIDLIYKFDTVRVYNIHLESISLNYIDYSFVTGISPNDSIPKPNTTKLIGKLKKALINRTKQVLILKEHISNTPYPVIVCGDFNELPNSYNYKKLAQNLNDAFIESGAGIGKTFNGNFPAFRIDYILFDPVFGSSDYSELNINLSDHFPISTELYLK
jgi:endonuclease/exonuclease/phosphatase family metal-dependent hydrolase